MTIPKLISNRHGRAQPMTKEQSWFFEDNGYPDDDSMAFNDPWFQDNLEEDEDE